MSIDYNNQMDKAVFLEKIGTKIKIVRTRKKISQAVLADRLVTDRGYISNIENGKVNFSVFYLRQIADALDVDIREFFDFTI